MQCCLPVRSGQLDQALIPPTLRLPKVSPSGARPLSVFCKVGKQFVLGPLDLLYCSAVRLLLGLRY